MGFNTWNTFGPDISDAMIRETADAMVEKGLRDAGYTGKAMNLLDGVQGWINEVDPTAKQI